MSEHVPQPATKVGQRAAGAVFLAFVGLISLVIGIASLYGAAWAAVVAGGVLLLFALILSIPEKKIRD